MIPDLFGPDRPHREPLAVAQSRTVDLGGRAQLRLLLIQDEYGERRILLGRGWEGDPVFGSTLTVPMECASRCGSRPAGPAESGGRHRGRGGQ
jgi:hypothetical protein